MKYLHNENYSRNLIIYPENLKDVIRVILIKILFNGFKWTWGKTYKYNWYKPSVYSIEIKTEKSGYPNTCSC